MVLPTRVRMPLNVMRIVREGYGLTHTCKDATQRRYRARSVALSYPHA